MADELIKFIDLPGIRDIELRCKLAADNRLFADERAQLLLDIERKSLELFGITLEDTGYFQRTDSEGLSDEPGEWEDNFEFLQWISEDEPLFWDAFDIDMRDDDGNELQCVDVFGRQLVCALKQLHPKASLAFRQTDLTPEQADAAAEAWARALLRRPE